MDECAAAEIRRMTQRIPARGQLRTAHRKQLLGTKAGDVKSGFVSLAVTYGEIDVLAGEVDVMGLGADSEVNLGVDFSEAAEPMNEPLRGEIRRDADS